MFVQLVSEGSECSCFNDELGEPAPVAYGTWEERVLIRVNIGVALFVRGIWSSQVQIFFWQSSC